MRRGEIWLIDLEPVAGAEMKKTRPVVIVSSDAVGVLPLRVIVPLTEWKERYQGAPWMVLIEPALQNALSKLSAADAFQVRCVSTSRFIQRVGELTDAEMQLIVKAIALVIDYPG